MFLSRIWGIVQPVLINKTDDRRNSDQCNNKGSDKTKQGKLIITEIDIKLQQVEVAFHLLSSVFLKVVSESEININVFFSTCKPFFIVPGRKFTRYFNPTLF
jgi:hypothetical protein